VLKSPVLDELQTGRPQFIEYRRLEHCFPLGWRLMYLGILPFVESNRPI